MDLSGAKEEVKKAADIVEVIGQYVELKKRGQNYISLCPFHSERSPSFTVNQAKQIYHCFGCGKGGDVFTFWMEYHNMSFPQSLRDLAERYSIPLPQDRNLYAERKRAELRELLFKINGLAADYFHNILVRSADGRPGREYFSRRHISQETVSAFRLGYAVNKWDGLIDYLRSKNISLDIGAKAGLLIPKKDGHYYDHFRGRIMFPIFDLNHQIIGFGGRSLDDSPPKYINTPETPLYHKGDSLYGLDSASKNIRERGLAIIVEGYMDMLVLRQHGISNAVAILGTALTSDQIRRLKGYTKDVVVLFDPDDAGREAALRSFPLFLNEGISAKVLVLPQGEDPDSFVNRYGADEFKELLKGATPIFDFYLDQALAHMDTGVDGKIKVLREALPIFMDLEQGATRFLYVHRFSEKTGINEAIVSEELRHREDNRSEGRKTSQLKERFFSDKDPRKYGTDLQFLNLLVHYPETIDVFKDKEWELIVSDPEIIKIIRVLMEQFPSGVNLDRIEEFLDSPGAREQIRVILMSKPFYVKELVDQAVSEFSKKIAKIKISQSISHAKTEGDMEMLNWLVKARRDLDLSNKGNSS
ncbi:MAG: DNA primase [Deltaproteobacteria bacterium]|nr:MAG: DNA primase [Deltaproteobacteria bacterium]